MSTSRRHTIKFVTVSKIALCALCGVLLLAGANPAYGGELFTAGERSSAVEKVRSESGFGKSIGEKADFLAFVATRKVAIKPEESAKPATAPQAADADLAAESPERRASIKMFLRGEDAPGGDTVSLSSILGIRRTSSTSLSLHDFAYRPAKRTLVQRLGDSMEINFSVGTNHQLDPGHYEEHRPSIGLLLERRFR